jgi:hypothetical protein
MYSFVASLGLLPSHAWCNQIKLATVLVSLPNLSPNAPESEMKYRPNEVGFQQLHDSAVAAIQKDTVYSYEYDFRKANTDFVEDKFHATDATPARELIKTMCNRANHVVPIDGSMTAAYTIASAGMIRLMYFGCRTLSALYEGLNKRVYEKFRGALYKGGNRQRGGGDDVRDFSMLVDDEDMDEIIKGMRHHLEERDRVLDMRYVPAQSYEKYYRILLKRLNQALYEIKKYGTQIAELYDAMEPSEVAECEPVECDSNQIFILPPSKKVYDEIIQSITQSPNADSNLSRLPLSIHVSKNSVDLSRDGINRVPIRRSARIAAIYSKKRPSYRVGGRFPTRKNMNLKNKRRFV